MRSPDSIQWSVFIYSTTITPPIAVFDDKDEAIQFSKDFIKRIALRRCIEEYEDREGRKPSDTKQYEVNGDDIGVIETSDSVDGFMYPIDLWYNGVIWFSIHPTMIFKKGN